MNLGVAVDRTPAFGLVGHAIGGDMDDPGSIRGRRPTLGRRIPDTRFRTDGEGRHTTPQQHRPPTFGRRPWRGQPRRGRRYGRPRPGAGRTRYGQGLCSWWAGVWAPSGPDRAVRTVLP